MKSKIYGKQRKYRAIPQKSLDVALRVDYDKTIRNIAKLLRREMQKMWKKRLAGLLAVVLAAVSLVGCQNASGDSAKEKVRLMVWSPSEDQSKDSGEWL